MIKFNKDVTESCFQVLSRKKLGSRQNTFRMEKRAVICTIALVVKLEYRFFIMYPSYSLSLSLS